MKQKLFLLVSLFFLNGFVNAQSLIAENQQANFQANKHYQILSPGLPKKSDEEVVYEFFSYMCPGCFKFEPIMNMLKTKLKPEQKIVRIPVAFYEHWRPHALTYYTLQSMGQLDKVHDKFFNAIHQLRLPLRSLEDIADWLAKSFQIDRREFLNLANSFQIDSQLRKAIQMAKTAGVSGVPTIIVNGQFKPDFNQAKSVNEIIDLTTYLLDQ